MAPRSPDPIPSQRAWFLPPGTVESQNVVFADGARAARAHFRRLMGDRPVRLASAGYSVPPDGYEALALGFLDRLAGTLDSQLGLLTSPTATRGSIDAITTIAGQRHRLPVGYLTADCYLAYLRPEAFPVEVDQALFAAQLKVSFPDAETYSRATAELSNSILVVGGRDSAVNDFKHAVARGNRAVIATNLGLLQAAWDVPRKGVENASAYLEQMLAENYSGIPMDDPANRHLADFLASRSADIRRLVVAVDIQSASAVEVAKGHLWPACP